LPRMRVDHVMNFAWKFMLPMAFACILAAAVWHYQAGGLSGWIWSLAIVIICYLALSRMLETQKKFAPRTYRFAE
ncbi:MAG: NADH-quinone oxidoreductase subunit H, partial [Gemmatimonadaceae bacterium]|nr:NADH-quinone oxidoreductase subunit H [Gemmatimonadaceae bacterium]